MLVEVKSNVTFIRVLGNTLAWVQQVHEPVDLWDITFCIS